MVIRNKDKSDELSVDLRSGSELKSSYESSEHKEKFKESMTKPPIIIQNIIQKPGHRPILLNSSSADPLKLNEPSPDRKLIRKNTHFAQDVE
jgi:hypothetical protein